MRVLVVHDRKDAAAQIEEVVRAVDQGAFVQIAIDGVGARLALQGEPFDFLIVDITIPQITGRTEIDVRTADVLLTELFTLETFSKPGDVIGITRDTQALEDVTNSLGLHMMTVLKEDEGGRWRQLLTDKLRYAALASSSRMQSANRHYWFDALIVTALDKEAAPFNDIFDTRPMREYRNLREFVFEDREGIFRRGALYSIGQSGQAGAASMTQSLISFLRPKVAMMSGFCGGVDEEVNLGDIVIFDQAYDWDYGKWKSTGESGPKFQARPFPIQIQDSPLKAAIRELLAFSDGRPEHWVTYGQQFPRPEGDRARLEMKSSASGSSVVGHKLIVQQIVALNGNIHAIDMESYGMYHACKNTHVVKPDFVCVKSVADYADGDKGDLFHPICSERAARVVASLLSEFAFFDY